MSVYTCPETACDFVIGAHGPLGDDEPDYFTEEIDAHRASHAPTDPSGGAVTSTPAPSDDTTPSLVELDRREAGERALAALIEWRTAVDVRAHIHATVALRKAADGYIAAVLS